jgi:catechol 2,3-dioxygenase-like lactoylglutathione lyase family enzyme
MTETQSVPGAIATAIALESVRFSAPDLAQMRAFLEDFGLTAVEDAGDGVLRMRGTGDAPFVHETVEGAPGLISFALAVSSRDDLEALARAEGADIEDSSSPGGGQLVRLTDPDGFRVEATFGRKRVETLGHAPAYPWNVAARREREGEPKRVTTQPSHVVRLGHVVLGVSDMERTWAWWESRFGLLVSDEVRAPNNDLAALFIRFNCGDVPVDHHSLNFASVPGLPPKFHHAAFEVADLDDLMAGNNHLVERGYQHDWGVGRHILGSQVFDYWKDPWGHRVEHWTDGDLFDARSPKQIADLPTMLGHQWGPPSPADFVS